MSLNTSDNSCSLSEKSDVKLLDYNRSFSLFPDAKPHLLPSQQKAFRKTGILVFSIFLLTPFFLILMEVL